MPDLVLGPLLHQALGALEAADDFLVKRICLGTNKMPLVWVNTRSDYHLDLSNKIGYLL